MKPYRTRAESNQSRQLDSIEAQTAAVVIVLILVAVYFVTRGLSWDQIGNLIYELAKGK
jgi:hypothetical protein